MYLKRLELQGFKSFANKTVFEFGPGITAVIGPNGSGKSNLADALRWGLGEQSSRLLRTRKSEDVIFGGSTGRATMGLAEINITLDNSDNKLPIDFSEIVFTRRIYRSGDSEYLLNRQRTRLRDATDLLLRANISPSGYAFIGQGQVDHVLSLRPEERRLLIEDAADVRRFRLRMEEAQDKLAATRENLDRVQLLVQEIEPRLSQLSKQAQQASDYGQLTRRLAQALQAWYETRWQSAHEALAAANAVHDQRMEELRAAQAALESVRERERQLERAIDDRRQGVSEQQEEKTRLLDEMRTAEQSLALDRERIHMLANRREEAAREVKSLEEELDVQPLEVLEDDRELTLQTQIAEVRERLAQERHRATGAEQALAQAQRDHDTARGRLSHSQTHLGTLKAELDRAETTVDRLDGTGGANGDDRRALLARLREIGIQFRVRWKESADLAEEESRFQNELSLMVGRVDRGREELQRADEDRRRAEVELSLLQSRLEVLKRLQNSYESFDGGTQVVLEAAGLMGDTSPAEARLRGVHGVFAQLLVVPEGLERAIETALGESLQAVVTDRLDEAIAAVELIMELQAGRVLVYPLEGLRPQSPVNLMRERGVIGVASTIVKCDRAYRPLVDLLLGRIIVVEDLATGQRLIRRGMGSVVTLDGLMLRPAGGVSGGVASPVSDAFALERELAAAPGEVERLEQELDALTRRAQVRQQAQLADENSLRRLRVLEDQFKQLKDQLYDAWIQHRGDLAKVGSELKWTRQQQQTQEQELDRARAEVARLGPAIEAADREAVASATGVESAQSAVEQARESYESVRKQVAALTEELGNLEAELRPLARIRQQVELALSRLRSQIAQRNESLAAMQAEDATLGARIIANEGIHTRLQDQIAEINASLEPSAAELHQLQARQRGIAAEIATAQDNVLACETKRLETEAVVRRCEEESERVREEIQREGIVIAGISDQSDPLDDDAEFTASPETPPLPPITGGMDARTLEREIAQLRSKIRSLGPINAQAQQDYEESKDRYDFLVSQMRDLEEAEVSFRQAIDELQRLIREKFRTAFREVSERFTRHFMTLFGGGTARLALAEPEDYATSGVEIMAQPPGKRLGTLTLLSGGERSLTAVSLLLALMETNPSPFCVLDEVDAALDEANVGRFAAAIGELAKQTQFILITHNRKTVEAADQIYGVSMGRDGVSSVLSLRLADLKA